MPTSSQPVKVHLAQSHRFHLLDAMRGMLAVLVVYRHAPAYLTHGVQTKNAFLAVDFFFCLSGFVIAYAYEERLLTKLSLRDFAAARVIRFYPTFLVGTLLAFLLALGPGHLLTRPGGHLIAAAALPSFFFLPSIPLLPGYLLFPLNMSSWTLFIELITNLGYAILVRGRRAVTPILVLVCVASWCVLTFSPRALDSGSTWPGALVGLARMGFSFPIGVFLLRFWKNTPLGGIRRTGGLPTAATLVLTLLAVIMIPTPFSSWRVYQLAVMTLVLPGIIFFGADIRLGPKASKFCAVLGELSYTLYIVHLPLLNPLFGTRVTRFAHNSGVLVHLLVPGYILILASGSWALRMYFDIPMGRWLSRTYNRRKAAADSTKQSAGPVSAQFVPN